MPSDDRTLTFPDQEHLFHAKGVEEAHQIPHDVENGVGIRLGRRSGVSVATEVGSQAKVAEGYLRYELVLPRVPELREAVQEEDFGAGAERCHVHFYAVGGHRGVLYLLHVGFQRIFRLCALSF
ncbi:hypothetical protein F3Y22_tig00110503pilonHSYRG00087 [Hibiscus syriacus]|uniref:Uncharacterized protein n=1 Tax=Hibiscus syriacus TaxID=106335 RepID=A0A6A3AGM1_HIBSY|nr:hypothetical protein F3Y22_tig00110503pilonHSYRG00087 [Hibiscus syriacus]